MGRFSAGDARLHEPRQPKPANATFRQGQPPRSRDFSLGLEHPQRTIRPACQEEPSFGRYRTASRAPSAAGAGAASASPNPPRRPRGALPASSPWNPTGRMPAQSAAGLLPGTRRCAPHARRPHRIPGGIGPSPAIRWGCWPSRAFANPALRAASRAYRPTSRARRPCIGGRSGEPRQKPCGVARTRENSCESKRLASADRGEHAARQQPYRSPPAAAPVQKAPKTALGRAAAPTQVHQAQCGTEEAPQERRRGCTRTPRRRRRSGWTRP